MLPFHVPAASITETSAAIGKHCTASGDQSTAMGLATLAQGSCSTAMGLGSKAIGDYSTAMGLYTEAIGAYSVSMGYFTKANSWTCTVIGSGINKSGELINNTPKSFMVGYMSDGDDTIPEFFVKDGGVGIGTTSPGYLLEVNGSAGKPGGGSWINSSDVRLKDITGNYEAGLVKILGLRPITFYYREKNPRGLPTNEEYIGFSAQEVQQVFPEAVTKGADGYLDFNMHPVNVAVINAIKELKTENEALKAKNASLKRDIEKIKAVLGITDSTGI